MLPYTVEETEWLSARFSPQHYWLLGQGDIAASMPAAAAAGAYTAQPGNPAEAGATPPAQGEVASAAV